MLEEDGSGNCLKETQPTFSVFKKPFQLTLATSKKTGHQKTQDCFSAKELWVKWREFEVPNYLKTVFFCMHVLKISSGGCLWVVIKREKGFKGSLKEGDKVLLWSSVVISLNTHTKTFLKFVLFSKE